jgi:hypothetical protein
MFPAALFGALEKNQDGPGVKGVTDDETRGHFLRMSRVISIVLMCM